MADVSSFFYMYAILPPEGQIYSPTHLESGLALVTCLTDRRYQKWHLGTFKARSWHDFAASIYLSFNIAFLECSPMEHSLGTQLLCCEKPKPDGKASWALSQQLASTASHVSEWRSHLGHSNPSRHHMEKNSGPRHGTRLAIFSH